MKKKNLFFQVLVMLLLLYSCRNENVINESQDENSQASLVYKKLDEFIDLKTSLSLLQKQYTNKGNNAFDIDESSTVIEMNLLDGRKAYSVILENKDEDSLYSVKNLHILKDGDKNFYLVSKYIPENRKPFYSFKNFDGEIIYSDIQGNKIASINSKDVKQNGNASNTTSRQIMEYLATTIGCYSYVIAVWDDGSASIYSSTNNCGGTGGSTGGTSGGTSGGSSGGDSGGWGTGLPSGGGGGGGGTSTGTTLPAMPNIPTEDYVEQKKFTAFYNNLSSLQKNYLLNNDEATTLFFNHLKDNFFNASSQNFSKWGINFLIVHPDVSLTQFQNWMNWFNSYKTTNTQAATYFNQYPNDLSIIFFSDFDINNTDEMAILNASANTFTQFLISDKNSTLSGLSSNWPGLETLKQKIRETISKGIYTTAEYVREYLVDPAYKYAKDNPENISKINSYIIDPIRIKAVTPLINFNINTMGWNDLFNIWLFELSPNHFNNNILNFTNASNVITGSNIYNPSTNAVKNFPKGNDTAGGTLLNIQTKLKNGLGVGQTAQGYFKYDVNAFYSTVSNLNIGIQMLGSFPIEATVISKTSNSAVVQFNIYNYLGWSSGTRFRLGSGGSHLGVIDNKDVGTGIHLGGTIKNNFTWTETVTF